MPKTQEEIQADYTRLCAQLGQAVLQNHAMVQEVAKRVEALNIEMKDLQAAAQQAAPKAEETSDVPQETKA